MTTENPLNNLPYLDTRSVYDPYHGQCSLRIEQPSPRFTWLVTMTTGEMIWCTDQHLKETVAHGMGFEAIAKMDRYQAQP